MEAEPSPSRELPGDLLLQLLGRESESISMQQETSTQLAGKPKKKRIRRQKLELEYLRELVVKLENKMTQLKDSHTETPQTKFKPGLEADAKICLVWKDIAQRQQKERERVEDKNKKLRVSLEGQLQLATKLQNLLRKHLRENDMEPLVNAKRFKPQPTTALGPTDDEIFADQLQHVERAHLEVDDLFGGPDFINRGELSSAMHEMHVMSDPNSDTGVAFITTANSTLPFDVKVAEKAFWRAITEEGPLKVGYVHDDKTNVRGKQTHRKFVDGSCIMVMWKSMVEPVEINGTKFRGLRCIQTGWIVLRGVNLADASTFTEADTLGPMMSTSLQSYSKMTLELQGDIVDQELQVGALTDFVVNSHYTIKELTGKMIKDLLLEEDWNLNGWIDNLSP